MQTAVQAFRLETSLKRNGTLTIDDLPYRAGDCVEVIVLPQPNAAPTSAPYPLRGLQVRYDRPFDSVASTDWNASNDPA